MSEGFAKDSSRPSAKDSEKPHILMYGARDDGKGGTTKELPINLTPKREFMVSVALPLLTALTTAVTAVATNINALTAKLLLDTNNRLKTADAVYYVPQIGVLLGTGTTLIYTAAASVKVKLFIANVSAAARTFQLSQGTITDTNSLFKSTPLVIGETLEVEMDLANGDVLRGLTDSASGVVVKAYVYTIA